MIEIQSLTKSYGNRILFDNLSFNIQPGEHLGLVGRNGQGKTTFFKLLTKIESPDNGIISYPKNYKIGYLKQIYDFKFQDIIEETAQSLPTDKKNDYWRAEKILSGLGLDSDMIKYKKISELSAGYQMRVNLAKLLVSEPDLLLLDEPTNYLDIISIQWLKNFLISINTGFILITHHKKFMDEVVDIILGIHRQKIRKFIGTTDKYYEQIKSEETIQIKTRENLLKQKQKTEEFISKFRAKARQAGLVQSRIKDLEKMDIPETLEHFKKIKFEFNFKPFNSKYILKVENLKFRYEDNQKYLIDDFNLDLRFGEKICIMGKNGKGKSTLINLLARQMEPVNGKIEYSKNAEIGYYKQTNDEGLYHDNTVVDEIMYSNAQCTKQQAFDICGALLFENDDAMKSCKILSGGEKNRVALGKIFVKPVNVLLLDEPTNHLDLESSDALAEALINYSGSVIMVTHNEILLNKISERLIIFNNDCIEIFYGNYTDFLKNKGWENIEKTSDNYKNALENIEESEKLNKKELKQLRSQIILQKSKKISPLKNQIERIENKIVDLEEEQNNINEKLIEASNNGDSKNIEKYSKLKHKTDNEIDILYNKLDKYTQEFEEFDEYYSKKLSGLD